MIQHDRKLSLMTLVCDDCGDELGDEFDNDDFSEMLASAKKEGWRVVREEREWKHYCPDCDPNLGLP